jgi:hypothetical protein
MKMAAADANVEASATKQTGPTHEIRLNAVVHHRFEVGDILRHVSGNEQFDMEVTGIRTRMENPDEDAVAYYEVELFENQAWSRLFGTEVLRVEYVDACYNKK